MQPQPGDFAVIASKSYVGFAVDVAEFLSGGGVSEFSHACICSQVLADGTVMIVEAMPDAAVEVPWHYDAVDHLWSTGLVTTAPAAGNAAIKYVGTPYGWLDYLAIAAHRWHLPIPGLRKYVAGTDTMICSQLVAAAELDAGVNLFPDQWTGYARPADLANLILIAKQQQQESK